jgi:hypothetical protein
MRARLFGLLLLTFSSLTWSQTSTFATVTASGIQDNYGNLLQSGQFCLTPVNQNTGLPMAYAVVGNGQRTNVKGCTPVTAGAITPWPITNTAAMWPGPGCYRAEVDDASGAAIIGSHSATAQTGYQCMQMDSTWCSAVSGVYTCNWASYQPDAPAQVTLVAPTLSAGTFTTGAVGSSVVCTVDTVGSAPHYALSCTIPMGANGPPGGSLSYPGVLSDGLNGLSIAGNLTVTPLTPGNCVQAGAGGQLTTSALPCGEGAASPGSMGNFVYYSASGRDLSPTTAITGTSTAINKISVAAAAVATLPSSGNSIGDQRQVSDALSFVDCTAGGGGYTHWCQWNGTIWVTSMPVAPTTLGGTGTGSTLSGFVRGGSPSMSAAELSGDGSTSGSFLFTLAYKYKTWSCQPGLGDGLNAIPTGTYLQSECKNTSGATWTITGIGCYTNNSGTSTLNVVDNLGNGLLSAAITCTPSFATGTLGGTTTIPNGDYLKFTFISDGASKQTTFVVNGSY